MEFTAKQIADLVGGTVDGNPDVKLSAFDKIESAQGNALTFLANPKYIHHIYTSQAGAVLVSNDFAPSEPVKPTLIRVADPYAALAALMRMADAMTRPQPTGIEQPCFIAPGVELPDDVYVGAFAYIGPGAKIGAGARIYPQAYIGHGAEIGQNTTIYAGAKIYHACKVGNNCIIHAGAVIGADGFGFAPEKDGSYSKIPQMGRVVIADNVEIGANTTVDRATMGQTVVGRGTKLDNLIQVAHNVEIGQNTVIASQTGIAGSTKVGSNCMIGGQVGFAGHINVGNHVNIGAQSGIHANVSDGDTLMGYPAIPARQWMMMSARLTHIGDLISKVNKLEKKLNSSNESL